MPNKVVIPGKVEKHSKKKHRIKAHKPHEVDVDIEILEEDDYELEKLSVDELPTTMHDGKKITWLNNFGIKKKGAYINQAYRITIAGLSGKQVVFLDNNSNGKPYYFTGSVENDTIELSDGDPGIGHT